MKVCFNNFFPPEVKAFVSDRTVDFSLNRENPSLTQKQQGYLSAQLGFPLKEVITILQVHGNTILTVAGEDLQRNGILAEADGLVTNVPHVPLAVRTADCLPVFIYDPKQKCIGLVHAGWRGSEKSVVVKALGAMKANWGSEPSDLLIAFGPAIRACCYEVGEELKDHFPQHTVRRDDKLFLDLSEVNKSQLTAAGVPGEHILTPPTCTCCNPDFFSYRRDGDTCGRHLSLFTFLEEKV